MSSDFLVGVDAEALGGVAYVEFYVEGIAQRASWSVYRDTDVNGKTRERGGYWITLRSSAFLAQSSNGAAHVFARAVPNDGTMQSRLIGPLLVYPRATPTDFARTIGAGADYPSVSAALAAAQAAMAEAPIFTFISRGDYELENGAWPHYTGGKGYCVFQAAPGVTVTLKRSSMPRDATGMAWDARYNNLEFRGEGVIIDKRHFTTIGTGANPCAGRLNGCKVTNSVGTRDSLYWFKAGPPDGMFSTPSYFEDATIEYGAQTCVGQRMVTNCKLRDMLGDVFTGTHFVAGNYHNSMDQGFYRREIDALTVAYTGPGSATIEKSRTDGANDGGGGSNQDRLFLRVDGVTVAGIRLGSFPWEANFELRDVVDAINANPGWSAVLLDDSRRASFLRGKGFGGPNGFPRSEVGPSPRTLSTSQDIHADWWQAYTGGATRSNVILRNNIQRNVAGGQGNSSLRLDAPLQDVIIIGNVFANGDWDAGEGKSHVYQVQNSAPNSAFTTPSRGCDSYCRNENNVLGLVFIQNAPWNPGGSTWPAYPAFVNCYMQPHGQGMPNSPNNRGNITGKAGDTLFVSPGTGDYRPAGVLLKNLRPRVTAVDGKLTARLENDAIGAWAVGGSVPSYPF